MKNFFFSFLFIVRTGYAQIALINTRDSIYRITDLTACSNVNLGGYCDLGLPSGSKFLSIAIHKDTVYFIPNDGLGRNLYRTNMGGFNNCGLISMFPSVNQVNSLTTDKDGILYGIGGTSLFRYDPYSNVMQNLGHLPITAAGDAIFYKDKLLYAAVTGIYEIDFNDPQFGTKIFIPSNSIQFYGLISIPFSCDENKYYGLAVEGQTTKFIELDMKNKKIAGVACTLPFIVYDGASDVDNGNTIGITISSLKIDTPCTSRIFGNINVKASSASSGNFTYTLDNSITNNSGLFNNVNAGSHKVTVSNSAGCSTDSTFNFNTGLISPLSITTSIDCDKLTGDIAIKSQSGYPPILYSINGSAFQSDNNFHGLTSGLKNISVKDASGCQVDSIFNLVVDPADLRCLNVYVPNSFTPNGDGINDIFKPIAYSLKQLNYFSVYNRWGEQIFFSTNTQNGWDGKVKGVGQNPGNYIWVLDGINRDGIKITLRGSVLLMR